MVSLTNLNAELNEAMDIKSHLHEIHEECNMVVSWQIVRHARTTARQHFQNLERQGTSLHFGFRNYYKYIIK